jgi:hypothetical protein
MGYEANHAGAVLTHALPTYVSGRLKKVAGLAHRMSDHCCMLSILHHVHIHSLRATSTHVSSRAITFRFHQSSCPGYPKLFRTIADRDMGHALAI